MAVTFQRRTFQPGDIVFSKGDPGSSLYLVEKGTVEIWRDGTTERRVLGRIEAGGLFGEMAVFDRQPRMASATAIEETVVLEMPGSIVRHAMNRADPLLVQLIHAMLNHIRTLARKLDEDTAT
jgi:CRP-like cAMP-binding protein